MPTVYSLLNRDAQRWWYHRQLREQGNLVEARKREHQSIRGNVQCLRLAREMGGYCKVGRGGWSLHMENGHTLSHYGGLDEAIPQCCLRLGIPVINTLTVPDERAVEMIKLPMIGTTFFDDPPYTSMSYAPLEVVARMYKELGATVYNLEV